MIWKKMIYGYIEISCCLMYIQIITQKSDLDKFPRLGLKKRPVKVFYEQRQRKMKKTSCCRAFLKELKTKIVKVMGRNIQLVHLINVKINMLLSMLTLNGLLLTRTEWQDIKGFFLQIRHGISEQEIICYILGGADKLLKYLYLFWQVQLYIFLFLYYILIFSLFLFFFLFFFLFCGF